MQESQVSETNLFTIKERSWPYLIVFSTEQNIPTGILIIQNYLRSGIPVFYNHII